MAKILGSRKTFSTKLDKNKKILLFGDVSVSIWKNSIWDM